MKQKRGFYCEWAYALGLFILAFGTALMERADFGLSMVVAPAYIIHLKLSEFIPWFSFGIAECVFQALLICIVAIVMRKVKRSYFLSFVTVFIYALLLDALISAVSLFPFDGMAWRIIFFSVGLVSCTFGIALLFHTYLPLESYELIVKEFSEKFNIKISVVKTIYDFSSCSLAIALSLIFFGGFVGIHFGTIITTILNGFLIGLFNRLLDSTFIFKDALKLRGRV